MRSFRLNYSFHMTDMSDDCLNIRSMDLMDFVDLMDFMDLMDFKSIIHGLGMDLDEQISNAMDF